ncbi:hypothetical protein SAMN06295924_11534 [Rathayibacter rathayi NCPPB 2980 = VKM Ac-1601]|nr:hypothetical protein [Rathayibacter rathayi NCPPB 2980 = VKM Ac-1601]SOE05837.1 hypothetical protein SAMN06295924_11534 [Rathayibacter rathayi NCPPB 2980 = VKM Ac-1601]
MLFPLVRDLAADGIAVAVACRVLGFSKQAFYAWKKQPFSDRDWDDAHLPNAAFDAHRNDPTSGIGYSPMNSNRPGMSRRSVGSARSSGSGPRSRRNAA